MALPSAFAIAEKLGASGRALLDAFVAGSKLLPRRSMVEPSQFSTAAFTHSATIAFRGAVAAAG